MIIAVAALGPAASNIAVRLHNPVVRSAQAPGRRNRGVVVLDSKYHPQPVRHIRAATRCETMVRVNMAIVWGYLSTISTPGQNRQLQVAAMRPPVISSTPYIGRPRNESIGLRTIQAYRRPYHARVRECCLPEWTLYCFLPWSCEARLLRTEIGLSRTYYRPCITEATCAA